MGQNRIIIIGIELFAQAVTQVLAEDTSLVIVDCVATVNEALVLLKSTEVDSVLFAESDVECLKGVCHLLMECPDLVIIRANLKIDYIQVFVSRRIAAHPSELRAALGLMSAAIPS